MEAVKGCANMRIMSGSIIRDGGAVRVTTNAIMRDENDREAIRHITTTERDISRMTDTEIDALIRDLTARDEMLEQVKKRRDAMLADKAAKLNLRPCRRKRILTKVRTAFAVVIATALFGLPEWYEDHRETVEMWVMVSAIIISTFLWAWALAKAAIYWGWIG